MLETRHANIEFLGKDGFQWFIAQVAPDKVWRTENNQNFNNGFRAKIRILGYHPGENTEEGGISDEDLPWAHFLVSPQFGAGNFNGGTSFALQGGEMVVGFFLDGEEAQQPVVFGSFFANYNIDEVEDFKKVLENGTSGFKPIGIDEFVKYGKHTTIERQEKQIKSGTIVNSNSQVIDVNKEKKGTIEKVYDNKTYKVKVPVVCDTPAASTGDITKALQGFFDEINRFEKFADGYIDPVLNRIVDMDVEINKVSKEISGAMSGIVRGARLNLFKEINEKVDGAIDFLDPNHLIKNLEIKKAKDDIFCLIENVLNGLKDFVGDFIKGLLGNILNIPLCAAEQFLSGLMSNITDKIQGLISPAISAISKFSGVAMPSFSAMMTKAMEMAQTALALFSCEGNTCETDPADFMINEGPDPKKVLNFNSLLSKFTTLSGSGLTGALDALVGSTFPQVRIGDMVGDFAGASPLNGLVGGCNVSSKVCGPPRIEIFGGGGLGAAADAVINSVGQVVGVNMSSFGVGYKEPPFVTIFDDCNNGKGATAKPVIEDGKVVNLIITNSGGGYLTPDNTSDTEGVDVIGQVEGIEIISTGIGYEEGDLIVSDSGQTLTPVIEDGRIVGSSGIIDLGLTTLPEMTVQTNTGIGADIKAITRFVKREDYTDPIVPDAELIRVISCPRFY
jgi:hypothetical protein